MGDKKRKQDLEDEMSRFEQEISGNLPPPPKLPNLSMGNGPPPPWMQGPHLPSFGGERLPHMPFPGPPPPVPPVFRSPMDSMHSMDGSIIGMPPMGPGFLPPPPPMMIPPPGMMPPGMGPMSQSLPVVSSSGDIVPPTVPLNPYETFDTSDMKYAGMSGTGGDASHEKKKKKDKKKTIVRVAGGEVWEDDTLLDWDNNDFRIFVGDLGNEVSDDALLRAFSRYPSILKAKVIRDKKTKKTKGFGFVSFKDPQDYLKAMREMNGKYVGNRPVKLRKSTWKDRNINLAKKKEKEKKKLGLR